MGRSRALGAIYTAHNRTRGQDFVYGAEERVRALRRLLPPSPRRVLDLGCRDRALAAALGLPTARTIGADIDLSALARATRERRLAPVACDLWGSLPFADDSFDLVLAGEVLEHIPFPDTLIAETSRVLTPDGAIVGSVPNAFRLKNRVRFLFGRTFEDDPTHLRHFSPTSLAALLGRFFSEVTVVPCVGRLVRIAPRLTANDLAFSARRPHERVQGS
jgi:SAM-dependent methyltransferase